MGWVTVAAYGAVVFFAWQAIRTLRLPDAKRFGLGGGVVRRLRRFWWLLFVLFAFLMVNKQLDLQTALTEIGRAIVRENQLNDDEKRTMQLMFVGVFALGTVVGGLFLALLVRGPGV